MGTICSREAVQLSQPLRLSIQNSPIKEESELIISPGIFVKENSSSFYSVYKLESQPLGSGRNGEVRKCIHIASKDVRVVKIIAKSGLSANMVESREVFKEVEILKTVDHPNLPRIYEFFEDESNFYIVLELCSGGDLFDRVLEVKRFSESQAAEIMSQVLSGLTYLHAKKIVHRDIKLENILLENKENLFIKIIDFDTATFFKQGYERGIYGTPMYMAPEVVKGRYTENCDLWSCGIILYILLQGRPPYDGTDEELFELLKDVKINIDADCAELSESCRDLLKKLLEPEASKRISAEAACMHPWIKSFSRDISVKSVSKILLRMKSFRKTSKLKEAIHTFIISKIMDPKVFKAEDTVFSMLDVNKDGMVSTDEIMHVLREEMPTEEAEMYSEMIMENADSDKNGYIDYTEFLRATVKNKRVCTKENLLNAFNYFDSNGNGTIEFDELSSALTDGATISQSLLNDLMNEVDRNKDGKIDLDEFENLLEEALTHAPSEENLLSQDS